MRAFIARVSLAGVFDWLLLIAVIPMAVILPVENVRGLEKADNYSLAYLQVDDNGRMLDQSGRQLDEILKEIKDTGDTSGAILTASRMAGTITVNPVTTVLSASEKF